MKLIVLTDCSKEHLEDLSRLAGGKQESVRILYTDYLTEGVESSYILFEIDNFSKMANKNILLIKFSGRESIVSLVGAECSEMILYLSYNKNSRYFVEKPNEMFLELINIFEKGEVNGITIKEGATQ